MNLTDISSPRFQSEYLQTLPAIRERCTRVFDLAKQGKLEYFDYHPGKESVVIDFCAQIIQVWSLQHRVLFPLDLNVTRVTLAARLWQQLFFSECSVLYLRACFEF